MAQTLVRILFDDRWAFQFDATTRALGVGWLWVFWIAVGAALFFLSRRPTGAESDARSRWIVWAFVAAVLFSTPLWTPRVAPSGVPVYGYGFMLFLGFVAGAWTAARRAERVGIPGDAMWDVAMWIFFSGIIGARLFYVAQYPHRVFAKANRPGEYFQALVNLPDGGLVLYGGVIAAIIAFFVFCQRRKFNPLLAADIMIPSFFVGLMFGRLGCFLNGCCYGDRCELPWGVTFPKFSEPEKYSVPFQAMFDRGFLSPDALGPFALHPSQIYSSFNAMILWLLTAAYFRLRPRNGAVLAMGLLVYPITRFLIEFVRGDEIGRFDTALTISQWVSLCVFALGVLYTAWVVSRRNDGLREPPH